MKVRMQTFGEVEGSFRVHRRRRDRTRAAGWSKLRRLQDRSAISVAWAWAVLPGRP